jgi:TonB-linked SusC/RagA family outer membrane protein
MRSNNIGRVTLIFILSLSLGAYAGAQTASPDTVSKQEGILNIAYGKQAAWKVSSAISTVSGDELRKTFTPNIGNTLFGRLPGLTVSGGSNEPGLQTPTLRVRGLSTFGSGTAVLVIVDGIESTYDQLVPEEVESMTILKDASATAMFGSKGANGVLLVTTKRGLVSPLKVSFTTQFGMSSPMYMPKFLGSYDYASLYNEARLNDGLTALYTQADLDTYKDGSDMYFHPDVNWYDQLLRKSVPSSYYNLNFSGGTKVVRYFVLLNALSNQGLYKKTGDLSDNSINSAYKRYNFRSNVDINITDNLLMSLTLGISVEDKENPDANNTSNIFNNMASIPSNSFPVYTPKGYYSGNLLYSNPWGDLNEKGFYTSNGRNFQTTLKFTHKLDFLAEGLSISALASFNNSFTSLSNKSRQYVRLGMSKNASGDTIYTKIGQNTALTGSEGESNQWRSMAVQGLLNYNHSFGNIDMDAVMMFNLSNYTFSGGGVPYRDMGLFGRYTLTAGKKYIGELSFGYNGSESFPEGGRMGFFPAASLGWIISNEGFLQGNKALTFLKLRGSYGLTGNDNIGASRRYMWLEDYVYNTNYYLGTGNTSTATIGEGMGADSSITWEKQRQMNVGIEATLFNHLDLSVDIFSQQRNDIIAQPFLTLPQVLGVTTVSGLGAVFPQSNVGEVENKGFEAVLRYRNDDTKDIQYFVQASVWYAKNKIVYNAEASQLYDWLLRTGRPIGQPFGYEAVGFYADAADIAASPRQIFTTVVPGDIKYKDQNGDNVIDQNDYFPIGNPSLPTITGSLSGGIKYKGFDLDILLQGVTGNTTYLSGRYYEAFQNNGTISEIALGRWTPATAASATYPRLSSANNLNNYQTSSFWQRDGSYLSVRNIELGYSLPTELIAKIKVDGIRVYISGNNLATFEKDGWTSGIRKRFTGYPAVRTLSIGAKFVF